MRTRIVFLSLLLLGALSQARNKCGESTTVIQRILSLLFISPTGNRAKNAAIVGDRAVLEEGASPHTMDTDGPHASNNTGLWHLLNRRDDLEAGLDVPERQMVVLQEIIAEQGGLSKGAYDESGRLTGLTRHAELPMFPAVSFPHYENLQKFVGRVYDKKILTEKSVREDLYKVATGDLDFGLFVKEHPQILKAALGTSDVNRLIEVYRKLLSQVSRMQIRTNKILGEGNAALVEALYEDHFIRFLDVRTHRYSRDIQSFNRYLDSVKAKLDKLREVIRGANI